MSRHNLHLLFAGLTLWALLGGGWVVYHPGLSGNFMFDDWANLPSLGAYGPINHFNRLITYLLSGIAGPTGRPVALLSFLIDANNWPASPYPFKLTNVLIHLLNGALLAWLSWLLLRARRVDAAQAAWAAVLAAGIWLLHPFWVSTTLFIVQRMAMLAATFVLAGLIAYLYGRQRWVAGQTGQGYLWMGIGLGLYGLLATLSKENGALLPLLVLVIEATLLNDPLASTLAVIRPPRGWWVFRSIFIYLPLILIAIWFATHFTGMLQADNKGQVFTAGERLLTQTRVLSDYLWRLIVPRPYTAGLYHDNFPLSTNILHPWTTLPATMAIVLLLAFAGLKRRRFPFLSAAILFYFASQLLTATIIPLEMYFEQRSYLAAILLPLPLALWIVDTARLKLWARIALAGVLIGSLASLTDLRAGLWGQPDKLFQSWYDHNPTSPRAVTTLALVQMHQGHEGTAAVLLEPMARRYPDNVMIQLNLLSALCRSGGINQDRFDASREALAHTRQTGRVAYNAISRFIGFYQNRQCPGLNAVRLKALIEAGLNNPRVRKEAPWKQDFLGLLGRLALVRQHPERALHLFKEALLAQPRPGAALYEAALLGAHGYPEHGLQLLDFYPTLTPWQPQGLNVRVLHFLWLRHIGWYRTQMTQVRKILEKTLRQQEADQAKVPQSESMNASMAATSRSISAGSSKTLPTRITP